MDRIFKSQKRMKKYNLNRLVAWFLAVLMLFSALPTGSITVYAGTTDAVAQIGETTYPSLATAIENAGTANAVEIDMLAAVELTDAITINSNVTLDLNGFTLTTSSNITVAPGGNVVDNSETKSGLLKLGDNSTINWTSNSQVPVYNTKEEGYAFATMTEQVYRKSEMGADTFELIFKPDFGALNDLMAKGSIATNVDIGVNLEWTDAEGTSKTAQLVYEEAMDEMVKTVYAANSEYSFYIKATGANSFDNLTITPMVKSKLGTEWSDSEFNASAPTPTVDPNVYHKVDLTTMAEGDVVTRNVGTIQETIYHADSDATIKLIEDNSEGRFIKIDDDSTTNSPGFIIKNIDFSSGVKSIAFDLRINSASAATAAKINIQGAVANTTTTTHVVSLEIGSTQIGYYASAVGAATSYVTTSETADYGDWEEVVLIVDSDNDKFSLYYDGMPAVDNVNLRGDKDLNGSGTLYLWANGGSTSDFDIRNIVIYNGEIEVEVPETPEKPEPDRTLVNYENVSDSLNAALANSVAMTIGNSMARVNNVYKHIDPDNVYNAPIRNDEGEVMIPVEFLADVLGFEVSEKTEEPVIYHKLELSDVLDGDWMDRTVNSSNIQELNYDKNIDDTIKVATDASTNEKYIQVMLGEDEGRYIKIDDSVADAQPGFRVKDIDFSRGVKSIEFDLRINAADSATAVKVNLVGDTNLSTNAAHAISLQLGSNGIGYFASAVGATAEYVSNENVKATADRNWKKVVLTVDSNNDKFSLSYDGVPVFENANLRGNANLKGKAYLMIWGNNAGTSNVDIKNIVVNNVESEYHKVDLATMAEGDVVSRTIDTITEDTAYTSEQATVKVIANANEDRIIKIDDSVTDAQPGFRVKDIDFSRGVKSIEFDLRINAADSATAVKVNLVGDTNLSTNATHAISLQLGSNGIGYFASAVGATAEYVSNEKVKATADGNWKKVVLTVDSNNDKFSLFYDGEPVFENANLRGNANLKGKAYLMIWGNNAGTSNVDIKNIVVNNVESEYHKVDLATMAEGDVVSRTIDTITEDTAYTSEQATVKVIADVKEAGMIFKNVNMAEGVKTISLKLRVNNTAQPAAKILVCDSEETDYINLEIDTTEADTWHTVMLVVDSNQDIFSMYFDGEKVHNQEHIENEADLNSAEAQIIVQGYGKGAKVDFKDFIIYEGDIVNTEPDSFIRLENNTTQMDISVGNMKATVNGTEADTGTATMIKNDTLYVPLTFIAETFGKKVYEDERGLIIIADEVATAAKTEAVIKPLIAEIRNYTTLIGNKKYSDVPFSARYIRPVGHTTGTTEPQWGTYDASKRFMTTVNKWTYVTSGEDYAALYDMGYVNQGCLQPMLPASYGTSSLFFDGTKYYRSDGYGKGEGSVLWGCLSDERSYEYILSKAKEGIDSGILTWQFDDWAMNVAYASGAGCFCDKCMTGFTEYLRNNTEYAQVLSDALTFMNITDATAFNYKAYIQAKGITTNDAANTFATGTDPVSQAWKAFNHKMCNDFHVKLKAAMDEYAGVEVLYSFNTGSLTTVLGENDFGYIGNFVTGIMGETSGNRTTASEIYGQMLFSRAIGVENVISPLPKTDLDKQYMYAAIPMTYATGQYLVIAWDCYLSLGTRYYATLEELGGSYEFVREYPFLFDNYEIPEQVGYAYDLDGFFGYVSVGEDLLNKGVAAKVVGHKDDDYQIVITEESLRGLEAVIISQTDYDNLSEAEKNVLTDSGVQLIFSSNTTEVAAVENTYWTVRNSTEDIATVLRQNALYDNAPVVIHAVNYAGTVAENVTIEINNRYLPEGDTLTVNVYKPWENSRTMTVTKDSDGITEITIDSVDNWTVLEVCGADTQRQEVSFNVGTGLNGIGLGTRISQDKAYATTDGFKIVTYSEGLNSTTYGNAGVQDEAAFIYKRLGYSQLTELVTSAGFEGADGAHGVMVREGLYSNARFVALMYDSENGLRIAQRDETDEVATYTDLEGGEPKYMKLERHGSEYQAFVSEDGVTYTKVGTIQITFSEAIGGVFATSPDGSMEECVVKNFVAEEGDYLAGEEFTKFEISYGDNNSIGRYTYNEKLVMDLATTNFTGLGVDDVAITFTSTNEGVVKISSDGTIIPVAPGTATITATASMGASKSISDSVELTVVNIEKDVYQESFAGSELPSNMTPDNTAIAVTDIGGEHGYVLQAKTATSQSNANVVLDEIMLENLPVTYEFDYRATFGTEEPSTGSRVLYAHDWQLRFIAEKDGFKWISTGDVRTKIADIEEGKWYHIKVTVDYKNNCASVWIDNTLVLESEAGFSAFSPIFKKVQLGGWRLGTDSCYEWDNIHVYYDVE